MIHGSDVRPYSGRVPEFCRLAAILQDKLLVFADEAFWAGDKQAEGVLKGMVTEEMNVIEHKGKDAFKVKNYIRLIVASNYEWSCQWVLPSDVFA